MRESRAAETLSGSAWDVEEQLRRCRWGRALVSAGAVGLIGIWVAFDQFMSVPWPPSLLGEWIPALKIIPSV